MASLLDYNTQYLHYWSCDPGDILFGTNKITLSSKYSGISICHPIYDEKAMTLALRHAIFSAILNTEATATFMFLPASGDLMITDIPTPNSSLLTRIFAATCSASLGLFQKPGNLPQHTRELQIIAVWNTTARVSLNNQNLNWLRGLAKDIPELLVSEAKWLITNVGNKPIINARHTVMPGIGKCKKLPLAKKQIAKTPHQPAANCQNPPSTCKKNDQFSA
eukprot:1151146-Pelagomonas_calceolata.AAC.1